MSVPLPTFAYHPDPLATGMVVPKATVCASCKRARGLVYVGPVYSTQPQEPVLCPWCIADGSAHVNLGASFADAHPLLQAGIAAEIVEEVNLRTPGYESWQQEQWLAHCNDACEFHGDASSEDVKSASQETKSHWLAEYRQDEKGWLFATEGYRPGGDSALYKFVCRHCKAVLFGWDLC
ncbi:CbrC family protein [Variovorax sp. LjRoot84]|uniref:CbrC family protein n=1 Tax=Variovorax sp. LjRoot84 TaxID=3342340 RepID=UPI003F513B78